MQEVKEIRSQEISCKEGETMITTIVQDVSTALRSRPRIRNDDDNDILFIHKGRLEAFQPADSFFEKPDSEFAKAFIEGRLIF